MLLTVNTVHLREEKQRWDGIYLILLLSLTLKTVQDILFRGSLLLRYP
jgi:hypothetical protein